MRFLLVEADTSYNVLIRRRTLNALGAIVSTSHMAMKFPSEQDDIIIVKAEPKTARECYAQSLRVNPYTVRGTNSSAVTPPNLKVLEDNIKEECNEVEPTSTKLKTFQCFNIKLEHKEEQEEEVEVDLDLRAEFEENKPTFDEPITLLQLGRQPEHCTKVGRITNGLLKKEVERVIIVHADLFAWSPTDMPSIDLDFM